MNSNSISNTANSKHHIMSAPSWERQALAWHHHSEAVFLSQTTPHCYSFPVVTYKIKQEITIHYISKYKPGLCPEVSQAGAWRSHLPGLRDMKSG